MLKKVVIRRIGILLAMVVFISTMPVRNTVAATTPSYGPGVYYLGNFSFQDQNNGAQRTYNARKMRIKIAWKKGEWQPWASDVNMTINVFRASNWKSAFYKKFTPANDPDGKDGNGYYYVVSDWFTIDKGYNYRIGYDASTVAGAKGTGHYRKANVHTWIELKN